MCQSKKEENPLPNLVGKSEAHPSSLSLSLSLSILSPISWTTPRISLSLAHSLLLSTRPFYVSRRQFTGPTMSSTAGRISACGFLPLSLPLSPFYYLSLFEWSAAVTVIWRCMGGLLSLTTIFSSAWQEERVSVKVIEGKGKDVCECVCLSKCEYKRVRACEWVVAECEFL